MFFRQPEPRPNPLHSILHHTAERFGTDYLQERAHQKENDLVNETFKDLTEDTSPLQVLTKISGLNVSPDKKQMLFEGFKNINAQKTAFQNNQIKQTNEQKARDEEGLRSKRIAEHYGLSEDEVKDLKPADVAALGKQKLKNEQVKGPSITERPIDPEQLALIQNVRGAPGYKDLDEVERYQAMTDAGVSRANAEAESKLRGEQLKRLDKSTETSYKRHEDFINDATSAYKGFETEMKPRLLQMQKLISDDQLIKPTARIFLDSLGIPLGALENPDSELFNKLTLDLLKGLPETYGNRILKVEVENFLKTIPDLTNSPNGRRMIATNMLKLGEMKEIFYNEIRRNQKQAIENNKPLPVDFQQRVLDQVKPQIDKFNDEFVALTQLKKKDSIPIGEAPFFDPNGQIIFIPKQHEQWAIENGGKRIW